MKRLFLRFRLRNNSGFTLIELLVVMGIIAILAGVIFPVAASAINSAKRARANATIANIQTAVLAYNTEYGVYPVPTGTTADTLIKDDTTGGAAWATLIEVLSGDIQPSTGASISDPAAGPTNTRKIAFLNLKGSDVFPNGGTGTQDAPKNPLPTSATANIYFNIAMDSDYDGILGTAAPSNLTTMPNFATSTSGSMVMTGGSSTAGVAVWANCNGGTGTNPNFWVKTY